MPVVNTSVTVSTTATELVGTQSTSNIRGNRTALYLYNNGAVTVYVGGPSVTTSLFTHAIPAGSRLDISAGYKGDPVARKRWYGIVAAATSPLLITEVCEA